MRYFNLGIQFRDFSQIGPAGFWYLGQIAFILLNGTDHDKKNALRVAAI